MALGLVGVAFVSWQVFGFDPLAAVGIAVLSGLAAYFGILFTPCVLAGTFLVLAAIIFAVVGVWQQFYES